MSDSKCQSSLDNQESSERPVGQTKIKSVAKKQIRISDNANHVSLDARASVFPFARKDS